MDLSVEYAELEQEVEDAISEVDIQPVSSQPHDWTISTLRDKHDQGKINLQPHYQREYVWEQKPEIPSRLIESILLEIPIPPLYFIRLDNGKIEVVDGQQRLTTLIKFVTNELRLQKLQKLSSLNGKLFKELSDRDQEKISDAPIRSIVINASKNHELRYEIFERLNRGVMALNEQEIRNCAYRGLFCDLLAELENDANWRKVKGGEKPQPRFVEREMILRFFAFANRIEHYGGNLKKFLNDYMGKYAPNEEPKVSELKSLFKKTIENVHLAFGENSARIYTVEEDITSGKWEPKFSISALDIQASALIGYPPAKVKAASASISEAYKFYLATNPHIREAITKRPAQTEATRIRWFGFKIIVQEILSSFPTDSVPKDPLFTAKILFKVKYFVAAGAVAGIVLEKHLKDLFAIHSDSQELANKTIGPLNQSLKAKGIYDEIQFQRIGLLGQLRNRCSHATPNPPTKDEVWELIEGVQKFVDKFPLKSA